MELKSLIEAILFAAQKPLSLKEIKEIVTSPEAPSEGEFTSPFKKVKDTEISKALQELKDQYTEQKTSYQIQEVAGAYQFATLPPYSPWLSKLFERHRSNRLSQPALETLAIIAYRQPITRADIEGVRGVAIDGVMQTLLERDLIAMVGRAEVPGKPMLFGTTRPFLEYFGLNDLNDLPAVEELRKIEIRKHEAKPLVEVPEDPNANTPAAPKEN